MGIARRNDIAIFNLIIAIYCNILQLSITDKITCKSIVLCRFYWMSITYVTFNNQVEIEVLVSTGQNNTTRATLPICF